jgi:3-deoxy-manno-octulosonate cytidylyltransferase (CMP-KDO synthetase)
MSVAVILPARMASTRLPGKLLLEAGGKTILEHTVERAKAARALSGGTITRILVAADDERLMSVAARAGVDAVMTDPNHPSGTDRVAEAARALDEEIIVNVQADEPEIDPASILRVAALLREDTRASMSTLATPIFDEDIWWKPNVVKVITSQTGNALYFSRSPIPHLREEADSGIFQMSGRRVYGLHHIGIYGYRAAFLQGYKTLPASILEKLERLEQLRALDAGHTIKVAIVDSNPPGIDTQADYEQFCNRILGESI